MAFRPTSVLSPVLDPHGEACDLPVPRCQRHLCATKRLRRVAIELLLEVGFGQEVAPHLPPEAADRVAIDRVGEEVARDEPIQDLQAEVARLHELCGVLDLLAELPPCDEPRLDNIVEALALEAHVAGGRPLAGPDTLGMGRPFNPLDD